MARSPGEVEGTRVGGARRRQLALAIVGAAALSAVFASSDRGRSSSDALEECVEYTQVLRRCFGNKATIVAPRPPHTESERAAARKRCVADRERIERACR